MAKWKDIRKTAVCKSCGTSLAEKPTKSKFCSLKCCGIDKIGTTREDCRKYKTCKSCGKTGFGVEFWNHLKCMCWNCSSLVPKTKNRKYKTCDCGFVGYGTASFPSNAKGKCHQCWKQLQKDKKGKSEALLLRPCKVCGKAIGSNDHRKVVCSRACAFQNLRKDRIEVKCCNCGKPVFRYPHALKVRSVFSCSFECQRQYALFENRSSGVIDWIKKSAEAKQKWKRASSRERRLKDKLFAAVAKKLCKVRPLVIDTDSWEYRVGSRLAASVGRRNQKRVCSRQSNGIESAISRLDRRRAWWGMDPWEKKVSFKLSSHSQRRGRKNAIRKAVKGGSGVREDSRKWVQVCFEWMGDFT